MGPRCALGIVGMCTGAKVFTRVVGVCIRVECEFRDSCFCECARRVIEYANRSEGTSLIYEVASGCGAFLPTPDYYVLGARPRWCQRGTRLTQALFP